MAHFPSFKWERPDTVEFPKVWHKFVARDLNNDNLVEYRIQDMPLNRADDLVDHLLRSFFPYEPAALALGSQIDPHAVDDYKTYWKPAIANRMALVCFKEGSDEIVGTNLLYINTKDDHYFTDIRKFVSKCLLYCGSITI